MSALQKPTFGSQGLIMINISSGTSGTGTLFLHNRLLATSCYASPYASPFVSWMITGEISSITTDSTTKNGTSWTAGTYWPETSSIPTWKHVVFLSFLGLLSSFFLRPVLCVRRPQGSHAGQRELPERWAKSRCWKKDPAVGNYDR